MPEQSSEQKSGVLLNTKKCSKCEKIKPVNEFYGDITRKDGLQYWCKFCHNKWSREYKQNHKEKTCIYNKEYHKKYYQENKEIILKRNKAYSLRPEVKMRQKEYMRIHVLGTTGKYYTGLNKRPYPQYIRCELCGNISKKLDYHHWDDNNPNLGIWVCYKCHSVCEAIEHQQFTSISEKYKEMKKTIEKEHQEKLV